MASTPQPDAQPAAPPSASFVRFFSSVEGKLVSRYGSATTTLGPQLIGAERTVKQLAPGPGQLERTDVKLTWFPERIIAITELEARAYRREYDQAIAEGALLERKPEHFDAYVRKQLDEEKAAAATVEVAAEKAKVPAEKGTQT